jgi:poly(A) polymerase
MIKKFLHKLIGKDVPDDKPGFGKRRVVGAKVHGINPEWVDERALNVVRTLHGRGFEAYIVGGAVRDLLLGLKPKDFDVATDATPEQVKSAFRRAFIIGRRFRIVHVVFGRGREHEVIEVSTFRAHLNSADAEQVSGNERTSKQALAGMSHAVDASGRVLRDNVWGPQDEDAARRDFTLNAMYYDPETGDVIDYHGGIADAKKRVIRMIGDPAVRYREDPVRIIRAIRFAAKLSALGFKMESKTAAPLKKMISLLRDVPQSRLFDEMLKLLQTGHALASIEQLQKLGLAKGIYPLLDLMVERSNDKLLHSALMDTDRRVGEGKPVAPSFLLACALWPDVRDLWERKRAKQAPFPALQEAVDEVFDARVGDVSGRGKLGADMREIWMMQPRFDKRVGNGPWTLVEQARFRAGFDFMRLRAQAGEIDESLGQWWEDFSLADERERADLLQKVRAVGQKASAQKGPANKSPRVHTIRKTASETDEPSQDPRFRSADDTAWDAPTDGQVDAESTADAPKKRRRRRKKPSSNGSSAPPETGGSSA